MRFPILEQEVMQAEARRFRGDMEKVSTTGLRNVSWKSVSLESRYGKAHELETMADMVEELPANLLMQVEAIFCDSKATRCYTVRVAADTSQMEVESIGKLFESAIDGHNGIYFEGSSAQLVLDPNWDWPSDD